LIEADSKKSASQIRPQNPLASSASQGLFRGPPIYANVVTTRQQLLVQRPTPVPSLPSGKRTPQVLACARLSATKSWRSSLGGHASVIPRFFGALGGTRTPTILLTATSRQRVYQFRHERFFLNRYGNDAGPVNGAGCNKSQMEGQGLPEGCFQRLFSCAIRAI